MKKLLVLVLALVMVFSLASCKTKCEKKGHIDEDANSVCDRCDASLVAQTPHSVHTDDDANGYCDGCGALFISYGNNKVMGTLLRKNVEKQFTEAKSVKIEFEYSTNIVIKTWDSYYDSDLEDEVIYLETETEIEASKVEVLINKTENGFEAKITQHSTMTTTYEYSDEDEIYTESEDYVEVFYILDGFVYKEIGEGVYTKTAEVNEEIKRVLSELSASDILPADKKNELLDTFGTEVAAVLDLKDNKGSVSIDLADKAGDFIDYVTALDFENDTVSMLINDALALVSEDLTVEAIVTELERVGALTVNEGLAELDAWLTENHNTTVQGIYDSFMNDPEIIASFKNLVFVVNGLDSSDPQINEDFDAFVAELKEFKFADYIVENELSDVRIYDFVCLIIGIESAVTSEEFFGNVRAMLNMSLQDFDDAALEGRLYAIKNMISTIKVNALNAKVDVNFKNILEISDISASFNFAISRTAPSEFEGKEDSMESSLTASFKIYDISNDALNIELPEDQRIVDERLIGGFFSNGDDCVSVINFRDGDELFVEYNGNYYDSELGGYVTFISSSALTVEEALGEVITIVNPDLYYNGSSIELEDNAVIKISFDIEQGVVTFVELPEFTV